MQGYIRDYRKEVESDVWLMPPLYHRTWQWLKYNVNHDEVELPLRDGTKLLIKRGQRLTSVRDLAKATGWFEGTKWKEPNPKTVSVILEWMEKQGMILVNRGQGNRQYTLITLINWDIYNPKEIQGNSKVTVGKHLVDINNNDLNDLNDSLLSTTATTSDSETLDEVHRRIYGTFNMTGMISGFVVKYKKKGFTDSFLREVLLEAAESNNNGGKPSLRQLEVIAERWERDNIFSRVQNKQDKQDKEDKIKQFPIGGQAYAPRPDTRRESFAPPNHADDQTSAQAGAQRVSDSGSAGGYTEPDFNQFVRNKRA